MKRVVALMLLSLFSIAVLSGCNTVKGFGKDVQKVGEKVEESSGKWPVGSANGRAALRPVFFCARARPRADRHAAESHAFANGVLTRG